MKKYENSEKWIEDMANNLISIFCNNWKCKITNKKSISAIFLAWAPWSWKTEFLDTIFNDLKENFIIINIDKYRKLFIGYNWDNSGEYQLCSVKVADKVLSYCFKNNLNFVFDWTFRNYNKIKQNFWQCKKYNRRSLITLIFQDPRISYYYTFLRKIDKKRNVPIDVFVDWFYSSIENVFKTINKFKNTDLMIAEKRYHPFNKDKSIFKMDYKTLKIIDFCKKYWILYKKWKFIYRENLQLDIENFNDKLWSQFWGKWTIFWKIKIWFLEKFFKS